MASNFQHETLKVSIAQICQTIGFQGINSTPLNVLVDLLHRYLSEISGLTYKYCEHYGRTEPTVEDLELAFNDLGISAAELEEYTNYVDSTPFPHSIPRFPILKPSNLNFLKPGSREILSRPLHIHEHLPPMYPEKEDEELNLNVDSSGLEDDALSDPGTPSPGSPSALKRPSEGEMSQSKKSRIYMTEEGQPVREIDSVMMTTSGFISSAREGKMPEAKKPNIPMGVPLSNSPTSSGQALIKKKNTMEKIFRHRNQQGGIFAGSLGGKLKHKDFKVKPKFPSAPPGTGSLKPQIGKVAPKLKIPTPKIKIPSPKMKVPSPKMKIPSPKMKIQSPKIKIAAPKIKIPTPKIKIPSAPSENDKKEGLSNLTEEKEVVEKKKKKDKNREPKSKEEGKHKEKKIKKEHKEGKKDREGKKDKESKRDRSKKEKVRDPNRERDKKEKNKDRPRIRARGLTKEEELARYKAREMELIAALEASASVTVTSIPPPHLRVRNQTPEPEDGISETIEVKPEVPPSPPSPATPPSKPPSPDHEDEELDKLLPQSPSAPKLQIFRKIHNKGKIDGDKVHKSREGSPNLLIDDKSSEEKFKEKGNISDSVLPSSYPSPFVDDASPPATPKTPEIVHPQPRAKSKTVKTPGRKIKDKDTKDKPKGKLKVGTPSPRVKKQKGSNTKAGRSDCPKTPEGLSSEEQVSPGDPSTPGFSVPIPNAPSFIPPFTRFPFIPPFVGGSVRPPMADFRTISQMYMSSGDALGGESKTMRVLDDEDQMERPITPRHEEESPTLAPTPETPPIKKIGFAEFSQEKSVKSEKSDKREKKEHKKEKKEKEKRKKDKKDKIKEEKKKEKERLKLEKKKKRGRKRKLDELSPPSNLIPKITLKIQSDETNSSTSATSSSSVLHSESTPLPPKVVIKPVIKFMEDTHQESRSSDQLLRRSSSPVSRSSREDDEPGSPEIAKFSALITRPPKGRSHSRKGHRDTSGGSSTPLVPPLKIKDTKLGKDSPASWGVSKESSKESSLHHHHSVNNESVPPLKIKSTLQTPKVVSERKKSPGRKSEKKEKRKKGSVLTASETDVAGGILSPIVSASTSVAADIATVRTSRKSHHVSTNPIAHSTPLPPQSSKTTQGNPSGGASGLLPDQVGPIGHFVDDQGNEVWICPTCGKQDDGSPMIGCDTCDDWYHWVCVGIQVPPSEHENWYCPRCLSQHKQKGAVIEKKKRGRKRKII